MIFGNLMELIGLGFQEIILLINMEFMEFKEYLVVLIYLDHVMVQIVGLIQIIIYGYLVELDILIIIKVMK